jgi:segregation and condensation protein B
MDLPSILESLLVASEAPLSSSELARLVRARAAEFSEDSITENPENAPASDSPEQVLDLEALAQTTEEEIVTALTSLNGTYEKSGRSFVAAERAKGWKIYTKADYAGFVKLLFPGRKPERLSPPAMETLAIIAYRQPVTKSALEAVRGVSCDGMLQKLLDRELIKISGRADLPGRPLLYATTELFLEHFGITDIEELPNIELPDGTEEDESCENRADKTPTEDAETQLVLSAVEKPAEEVPSEKNDSEEPSAEAPSGEEE